MITARHIKAWEKFSEDLAAFAAETGEQGYVTLYEDPFTTREVKEFKMTPEGVLTWWEWETYSREQESQVTEQMLNEGDAREWLKFWRANLRRAKRYWQTDAETLDAIHDGRAEDIDED